MDSKLVISFLTRVESLVKERCITKQSFCDSLGLSRSSFINWKKQTSLPNADIVISVAAYFKVAPEWLIDGEVKLSENKEAEPSNVFNRIYNLLLKETKIPNSDYSQLSEEQLNVLWYPIVDIVSPFELINWQFNRSIPSYESLQKIAKHFHRTIEYIAEGIDDSVSGELPTVEVNKREYDSFLMYKKYENLFWSYDEMYTPDKEYVRKLINRFFRLRRFVEKKDFDFEYNMKHPGQTPRQLDPNVSDEEYLIKKTC